MRECGDIQEIAIPDETCGWVLVGRGARSDLVAGAVPSSLHRANIATLTIDLPPGMSAATRRIRLAAARMRDELAGGLPIGYLGAGAGAGAGWAASLAGGLDGVIAFNGTPGTAWRALRHVQVPSLLVVDGGMLELPWRLLLARTLSWRLGGAEIEIADGGSALEPGLLAQWYWDRILSRPPTARPRPRRARTRIATIGVAAGALVLPSLAATALPDFAAASRLPAGQIAGDNMSARNTLKLSEKSEARRLTASQIHGDNAATKPDPTGGIALIDSSGVKYFINNDITFSTSSSASAAMSEASYTHAVAATTANGGTVASTLNDAYDGYESLCVANDNAVNAVCETGNANYTMYNKNGNPSIESNGRQVDFNAKTINGLTVTRKVFVPSNDSFARWLDIVHNPGSSPAAVTLETGNNLGSDSNTIIVTDSSGNTTPTTSDTWVTTFQNFNGTTSSDPRLGHVLGGPGATAGLAGIHFQNGDDNPYWGYTVTVPAGATRIIMNYGVVQPSRAAAAAKSAELAAQSDSHQLDFMTPSEQAEVVNFAIPPSTAADSYSTQHDTTLEQPAPGVLGNDPGAGDLTAELATGPAHASSFTLNPDGSFSYTPAPGFAGTDSFTYEAKGAGGGVSAPTTVTLTVVGQAPAINSAATAAFTVGQRGSFKITTTGVPAAAITESGALPSGLKFTDNGDGTATISGTPAPGTHGSDTLTVTATNSQGQPATQQLTLQISRGAVPSASPHHYAVKSGQALTVAAPGLLSDASGESSLRAVLASGPTRGATVSLNPDGSFTYRAKRGFAGTDSFTYEAVDVDGGTSTPATVTISVPSPPNVTSPSRIEQKIKNITRATERILTSYRSITRSTDKILAGIKTSSARTRAQKLLSQAAKLAREARADVRKVRKEKPGREALKTIAAARRKAATARRLAAEARVIAARARANG